MHRILMLTRLKIAAVLFLIATVAAHAAMGSLGSSTPKGTQPSSYQGMIEPHDAGRTYVICSAVKFAANTSETMINMICNKGGVNQPAAMTYTVSAGKTLRLQSFTLFVSPLFGVSPTILMTSTVRTANISDGCLNTSPIVTIAGVGLMNQSIVPIPDGVEIATNQQVCVSYISNSSSDFGTIVLTGFEY